MSLQAAAAATTLMMSAVTFSDQINIVDCWFSSWNDCEKVVALYYLLRKLPPTQTKFLAQVLEQLVYSNSPSDHEEQANNPVFLNSLYHDAATTDVGQLIAVLLHCLPLLRAGNPSAKSAYLRLIPAVLQLASETGRHSVECQQLLSYALIHPAITADELAAMQSSNRKVVASANAAGQQQSNCSVENDAGNAAGSLLFSATSGLSPSVDKPHSSHGPDPTSSNSSAVGLFTNGGLGYQVTPQQQQQPAHQQGPYNRPQIAVGRTWSLKDPSELSATFLSNTLADPQLQGCNSAAAASLYGQCALTAAGKTGSSTQLDLASLPPTAPSSTSATPPLHLPLHQSKSASRAVPSRQGGGGTHPKLTRVVAVSRVGLGGDPSTASECIVRGADAVGAGRWDSSNRSSADMTPSSRTSGESGISCGNLEMLSSSSSSLHMPLSPQSSDASSGSGGGGGGSGDPHYAHGNNMTDADDETGMRDVLSWLKNLRLHKYSYLFRQMTYDDMMNLTDDWLATQSVTKGARKKILISVEKLHERPAVLRQIEKEVFAGNLRSAIDQLRPIINTPIKPYEAASDLTVTAANSSSEGDRSSVTDGSTHADGGRRASDSDSPCDTDLPGLITRVLQKLCTQLQLSTAARPDNDLMTNYVHLLDRCYSHQAFTVEQRNKFIKWKDSTKRMMHQQLRHTCSNSLPPPSQSRQPGGHRPLRGQASQPQEPAWRFIDNTPSSIRNVNVGPQTSGAGAPWRTGVGNPVQHPAAGSSPSPQQSTLLGAARIGGLHDSSVVKLPLSRTQSAPLRTAKPALSVINQPDG